MSELIHNLDTFFKIFEGLPKYPTVGAYISIMDKREIGVRIQNVKNIITLNIFATN